MLLLCSTGFSSTVHFFREIGRKRKETTENVKERRRMMKNDIEKQRNKEKYRDVQRKRVKRE